mgnify:CR=1 FL=1
MKSNLKKIIFPFVGDSIGGCHISTIITIKNFEKSKFSYQVIIKKKEISSLKSFFKTLENLHLLNKSDVISTLKKSSSLSVGVNAEISFT